MQKIYNVVKIILLLGTLCFYSQSSASTIEEKIEKGGSKRTFLQAGISNAGFFCFFKDLPADTIRCIIPYFDPTKDQNTLLAFSASCKKFYSFIMEKYSEANKAKHHYPWQDNLHLQPITLHIFNTRMCTILGLFNNISNNMAGNIDRIRFETLCAQFVEAPLFSVFPQTAVPVMYVKLLQLYLSCHKPTPLATPLINLLKSKLNEQQQNCAVELLKILHSTKSDFQNEAVLYFHYSQFVLNTPANQLIALENTALFKKLDNSLMIMMNKDLLALKATPGLSHSEYFADIWEKIIDLDPATTIFQLAEAAYSYCQAGENAVNPVVKVEKFAKAAKYFEEELKAIKAAGVSPTGGDYAVTADAYFQVGWNTTDPVIKAINFAKAAQYFEEELDALEDAKQNPTAADYELVSNAFYHAGNNAVDSVTKTIYFAKAAKYFEEKIKKNTNAVKQIPTMDDHNFIANAFYNAGENAVDSVTKTIYFAKAAEHFAKELDALEDAKQNPTVDDYSNIASAYYHAGWNAADPNLKITNFAKAVQYREKELKALKNMGKNPTATDYGNIAYAYYGAGGGSTMDPIVKAANFEKAAKYYEICLKGEIDEEYIYDIYNNLAKIFTYFSNFEKAAYYKNLGTLYFEK